MTNNAKEFAHIASQKGIFSLLTLAQDVLSDEFVNMSAGDCSSLLKFIDLVGALRTLFSSYDITPENIIHDGLMAVLEKNKISIDKYTEARMIALTSSFYAYSLQEEMKNKPRELTIITSLREGLLKFKEIGKVKLEKLAIALQEEVRALDNHKKTIECLYQRYFAVEHEKMSLSRVDDNTSVRDLLSEEFELNSVRTEKGSILAWIGYGLCAIVGIVAAPIIIGLAVATAAAGAAIYCAVTIVSSVSALVNRCTQVNVTAPGFSFNINATSI